MKEGRNIDFQVTSVLDELKKLKDSLQREFEFFTSSNRTQDSVLKAKKKQINTLDFIIDQISIIADLAGVMEARESKLIATMIIHGLTTFEISRYLRMPLQNVMFLMKELKKENLVQLPLILQKDTGSQIKEDSEVKITSKPLHPDLLKRVSEKRKLYNDSPKQTKTN